MFWTLVVFLCAVLVTVAAAAPARRRRIRRRSAKRVLLWHQKHDEALARTGDEAEAVAFADAHLAWLSSSGPPAFAPPPRLAEAERPAWPPDPRTARAGDVYELRRRQLDAEGDSKDCSQCRELREAFSWLDELLMARTDELRRLQRLKLPSSFGGYVRVVVPGKVEVGHVDEQALPVEGTWEEVVLGPADLRAAAELKQARARLREVPSDNYQRRGSDGWATRGVWE